MKNGEQHQWLTRFSHLAKFLLPGKGFDVNRPDEKGRTPLIIASEYTTEYAVDKLLQAGANVDACDKHGNNALLIAAFKGKVEIVTRLLKGKADINQQNSYGATALMAATQTGHEELVKLLLEQGANVNLQVTQGEFEGFTALMFALDRANYADNGTLTKFEAILTTFKSLTKGTIKPLSERIIQDLLVYPSDLNIQNAKGDTALLIAVRANYEQGVARLMAAGADTAHRNHAGEVAWALASKNLKIQNILSGEIDNKIYAEAGAMLPAKK